LKIYSEGIYLHKKKEMAAKRADFCIINTLLYGDYSNTLDEQNCNREKGIACFQTKGIRKIKLWKLSFAISSKE
jgi:hypothetical protein